MNCEEATKLSRERDVRLVVRWLDMPQALTWDEVDAVARAIAADCLERPDSIVSEAVQLRDETRPDVSTVSEAPSCVVHRGIHLVVRP